MAAVSESNGGNGAEADIEALIQKLDVEDESEPVSEQTGDVSSEHFIDDVLLKDVEITLSQEQLEKRKEEALGLKNEGNILFKESNFIEARKKYTCALRLCPLANDKERAILFANRGACFMKEGKKLEGIEDCTKAIELDSTYMKAYKRRARLYEETDKLDEALEDYKKIFEMDRSDKEAAVALQTLPNKITERNEKLKEQMLGTLKELGNKILSPFGLSTDNFKLQQDPQSGGYTINFQQNK